jgi:hypothetical protein
MIRIGFADKIVSTSERRDDIALLQPKDRLVAGIIDYCNIAHNNDCIESNLISRVDISAVVQKHRYNNSIRIPSSYV